MKLVIAGLTFFSALIALSCHPVKTTGQSRDLNSLLVRISEIEIYPKDLDAYKKILIEEAEASIRLEPGVISIYPMQQRDTGTQIRILEIYESEEAYRAHLKTPHFQKYKTTTTSMVRSLKLVDMDPMDKKMMFEIFRKLK